MNKVIVDELLRKKLYDLSEPLDLCDETGRVLGHFLPLVDPAQYEGLESPISREELERRKREKVRGYTTAEVLAYLEQL